MSDKSPRKLFLAILVMFVAFVYTAYNYSLIAGIGAYFIAGMLTIGVMFAIEYFKTSAQSKWDTHDY